MAKILVVDGYGSYCDLMASFGDVTTNTHDFLSNPDKYALVLFTGGEDICPAFYGHSSPLNMCRYNIARDLEEEKIFLKALEYNIPMTGICRGSQLLNVMCGGVMMHHIKGHGGSDHTIETSTGHNFKVTSTHHQMCVPTPDAFILGWSDKRLSDCYFGDNDLLMPYDGQEVEAIYYSEKKVFAVQYHPEFMSRESDGSKWFKKGVLDLITLTEGAFKAKYVNTSASMTTQV